MEVAVEVHVSAAQRLVRLMALMYFAPALNISRCEAAFSADP